MNKKNYIELVMNFLDNFGSLFEGKENTPRKLNNNADNGKPIERLGRKATGLKVMNQ